MRIYGAGLAGLLAANMLRRYKPEIHEAQPSLPNNHEALLRFRSDAVARATGIPFKKVLVHKAVMERGRVYRKATLRQANLYSQKVTGEIGNRSIMNLDPVERYIAPPNLIELLSHGLDIQYESPLPFAWSAQTWLPDSDEAIISTVPMPILMELAHWTDMPSFNYKTITSITADIDYPTTEVYQTVYCPDNDQDWYRASITGRHLIVELMGEVQHIAHRDSLGDSIDALNWILWRVFGISNPSVSNVLKKVQRYGKIAPIADDKRRAFILSMSDVYRVYSLGRYATWRNLLLDDVVHDVQVIDSFISQRSSYARKLREGRKETTA